MVLAPTARPSIWWPRQMPNTGFFSISARITGTAYAPVAAGSPGPLERKMPSGLSARMSAASVRAGTTVTVQPSPASWRRRLRLMPEALRRRHRRHEFHPDEARPFPGLGLECVDIEVAGRLVRDHRVRHAPLAD